MLAVNWLAVAFGWLVDFSLKLLVQMVVFWTGATAFYRQPDPTAPAHLLFFALLLLITGLGGFVAARFAEEAFWLNGLMVGLFAILASAVANPRLVVVPPLLIYAQIAGCFFAVLGGMLAGALHRRANPSSD
jgi:putative membrane protein (TIGR04086 family)